MSKIRENDFLLSFLFLLASCKSPEKAPEVQEEKLRNLEEGEYRTPRAGEGFRTEVFGEKVVVPPRDRGQVSAWDLGLASVAPGVTESEVLPFASLYFWRHPDDNSFFRGVIVGVYDEIFFSKSTGALQPWEGILTFNNFTVPIDQAEAVDGVRIDGEELLWGRVRPGFGFGYRQRLEKPGANDNMLSVSIIGEPGWLYFDRGHDTRNDFVVPEDTFEGRGRLQFRIDALERNLLELPQNGFAAGSDIVYGHRGHWRDWGPNGRESASDTQDYLSFSGYLWGASALPFLESERHRLIASLHGGTGGHLDRFSQFRVGGGPGGEEFEAQARPLIPGALIEEFVTSDYAVLVGEYRWEAIFFCYLSLRSSIAYVNRDRFRVQKVSTSDDVLASIGGRVTTGFLFETRIQIDYNYNTGVIRHGEFGGHEVVAHISKDF